MRRALALASVLAVSGTAAMSVPAVGAKTYRVKVDDDVFSPTRLSIRKGDVVRWTWVGDEIHNVKVKKGPQIFGSTTQTKGTYTRRLRKAGTYSIVCTIHFGMKQTIRVR